MSAARTVECPLRVAARRWPEAAAISSPDRTVSYRELDVRVSGLAAGLRGAGLPAGSKFGVSMPANEQYLSLVLAALRAGLVVAPVSTRLPAASTVAALRDVGARAVVSGDPVFLAAAVEAGVVALPPDSLDVAPDASAEMVPRLDLDAPATVVFTSGSTGRPKAALHTVGNHRASALGSARNIPLGPGDAWLHSLPLFHVGGLSILFRCVLAGATVALPGPGEPLAEAIPRSRATHVSLVSTQLRRLLDGGPVGTALSGLRAVLLGGSAIPADLLDRAHDLGVPVHTSYGLTEMTSQVTTTRPGASRAELATSGRVLPGREVRISERGEILVRGETLFAGYLESGRPVRPLDREGWFGTGDLGNLDTDGRLTVTGRLDNLFVSGGENVQPERVEEELRRLPEVEEAIVVPVADREFGERPVAFVRLAPGTPEVRLGGLRERLRERLAGFEVPDALYPWPLDAPQGMKVNRAYFKERADERHR
ncbi:menE: O-succinylbenzoate-CoA ligase [Rubrobacter radiotolerans]|uniref:MenE: O-succinylbenzoate-CoA ligase n=1 Tax=Rubrobacter radiotolerans TaxID=42256 RepID=A0A023X573_RUBRA|nr:o-succinylbenzoate--CoA ligase [Rubrobacter radiotolerans]AHY47592.1 menE: O-succinylbenzoate-CoA ligase [Rubrobacter radiotolerans]MDX5894997.1 o-succinylbenzoate--CoA ligase [Rubrobacter radiotolerans]SMC07241.1 2-succinylbenzoyl-CoA synthetase [Rubrobacter radiotolerans DSM 5868]